MKPARLPKITVTNRQRKIAVDRAALEHFAICALTLGAKEPGGGLVSLNEVSVVLISDRRIAELHQRFMQVAGPTDVITFHHGEVFISVETAQRQARAHLTSLEHELRLYLVHGLLHLQGFNDLAPAERAQMHATQEKIVAHCGKVP